MVSYVGAHDNHIISHDQTPRERSVLSTAMNPSPVPSPANKIFSLFLLCTFRISESSQSCCKINEVKMKQIS